MVRLRNNGFDFPLEGHNQKPYIFFYKFQSAGSLKQSPERPENRRIFCDIPKIRNCAINLISSRDANSIFSVPTGLISLMKI